MENRKEIGLRGIGEDIRIPDIEKEQQMKGINTMANDIRKWEEDYANLKNYTIKLEKALKTCLDYLLNFMDTESVKEKLREHGLEVD